MSYILPKVNIFSLKSILSITHIFHILLFFFKHKVELAANILLFFRCYSWWSVCAITFTDWRTWCNKDNKRDLRQRLKSIVSNQIFTFFWDKKRITEVKNMLTFVILIWLIGFVDFFRDIYFLFAFFLLHSNKLPIIPSNKEYMDLGNTNWYSIKKLGDSNIWTFWNSLKDSLRFLAKLIPICEHFLGVKIELSILILYNLNIVFMKNKLNNVLIKLSSYVMLVYSLFSTSRIYKTNVIRFKIFVYNCTLLVEIIHLFISSNELTRFCLCFSSEWQLSSFLPHLDFICKCPSSFS